MRRLRIRICTLAALVCCGLPLSASRAQSPSAIVAGRYVAPDGTLVSAGAIVLSEGRISGIKPADEVGEATGVVRYPKAVVMPGLIDLASTLGSDGQTVTSKKAVDPDICAFDAVDWGHRDFAIARSAGITTVLIAPLPVNLVAGRAVVARTADSDSRVLRREGPMVLSLGPAVWRYDREPTSRSGSVAMLRSVFEAARQGEGPPRMQALVKGGLDSMVYCADAMDVDAALRVMADVAGPNVLVYTGADLDVADELAGRGTIVVVGPYTFDTRPRVLALAGALSKRGIPVALAGGVPTMGRDSLRVTAALAVRYGMDPAAARRAISSVAAQAAGVAGRVGSIAPGRDADLVIFSDDPLRLDARVLAVYEGGVRVYADQEAMGSASRG